MRICDVPQCNRKHDARGLCHSHYTTYRRTGVWPTAPILTTDEARFWAKVNKDGPIPAHRPDLGPCWPWEGATASEGRYGSATLNGQVQPAHRVAYQLEIGPIPDDLVLDHLCRFGLCVRPTHTEPVTQLENILRGTAPTAVNALRTHCERGHEFSPGNTGTQLTGRLCLTCRRESNRERTRRYRERKKSGAA